MTDGPAFFRAIEADPGDDTPRLVYADWLDEHAESDADRAGRSHPRAVRTGPRPGPGAARPERTDRDRRGGRGAGREPGAGRPARAAPRHGDGHRSRRAGPPGDA